MNVFEPYNNAYQFNILPRFAQFVLDNHLAAYVKEQLRLSYKTKIPLLVALSARFSDEELIQMSLVSSGEILTYLARNQGMEQISESMEKWTKDQLDVVGKFDIVAQDITLINYIRQQSMQKLIPLFTQDLQEALELKSEIDTFILGSNSTAVDIYINILKNKIGEESHFSSMLIEASPAVTFVFDINRKKEVFVSGKSLDVMGYSPEELMKMKESVLQKFTHPEDKAVLSQHLAAIASENSDKAYWIEYRFMHKDGYYKWLRNYEVVFKRDEQGKPLEIMGKIFEVTQEKEIALALQQSETDLLEAQHIGRVGSYEWMIQENRSSATPELTRIFEMNGEQKFEEFITYVHPDDKQKVEDAIAESFKTGSYECEYRYLRNGKEKVIWSLGKVDLNNGVPVRMAGTIQDITEIKQIENELRDKTIQLEQSNENLQQFAFIASHDMKEPLRKIILLSDLVAVTEKGKLSQKSAINLEKIQASAMAMNRMIEDILSFSLLNEAQEFEKVSLKDLLEEVTELLDEKIREKGALIRLENLPEAWVIPSQFRQLFQNLISNSLKFSRKDCPPLISIEAKWLKGKPLKGATRLLQLTISDNGIGFPEHVSERIFELFKRLHSKAEYEGSGLGLAISKRIVENHGGRISAISEEGKGATFQVVIPQKET